MARQHVIGLAALFALSLGLPGCGDDDGSEPAPDAGAVADASAAPDAPLGDILERLNAIPGVSATEPEPPQPPRDPLPDGYRFFFIDFDQPVDHANPEGQRFTQRVRLMHRDENAPMLQHTGGYGVSSSPFRHELTRMTQGNQITVEHRYFLPSRPDPADWSFLTIEQAANDFHRINVALRSIYKGKWVSAGESKGGMTSLFNRRFFPDDVDATVPYVAPIMIAGNDQRFVDFLAEVHTPECRAALAAFQRAALLAEPEILPLVEADAAEFGWTFTLLGLERAFEHSVIELPFTFWQYGDPEYCDVIPAPDASPAELYEFLNAVQSPRFVSDRSVLSYTPYYFQAATQFGWPGFPEDHIADVMTFEGTDVPQVYAANTGATMAYDPEAMQDILDWLHTEGERFVFVYGEIDPWTAAKVDLGAAQDSFLYVQPGGNHGADLLGLPPTEQAEALEALSGWLGVTLTVPPKERALGVQDSDKAAYAPRRERGPL